MSSTLATRRSRRNNTATTSSIPTDTTDTNHKYTKEDDRPKQQGWWTIMSVALCILLLWAVFYYETNIAPRRNITNIFTKDRSNPQQNPLSDKQKQEISFVTIVMPSVVNYKERERRLTAIAKTWGPASHAIYVIHNLQKEYPAPIDDGIHILQVPSNITFDDGLPRLYHVLREVYQNYEFEYAFFVNDHTFVIPEHFCHYVQTHLASENKNIYVGHALNNQNDAFNSGAAGYILSRSTIKDFIQALNAKDPNCIADGGNKWLQGNPGLVTANCFQKSLNAIVKDTREAKKYHRFHAYGIVRMVMGKVDDWYRNKHAKLNDLLPNIFDDSYAQVLKGVDCCSSETISFHYVESMETMALHRIRTELQTNPTMTDSDLSKLIQQVWPSDAKLLGGYARMLPSTNTEDWTNLLFVLRRISPKGLAEKCHP